MFYRGGCILLAIMAALVWAVTSAEARPEPSSRPSTFCGRTHMCELPPDARWLPKGQAAPMPPGFVSFCLRFPDQCSDAKDGPPALRLDPGAWALLRAVNQQVNRAIRPMDDRHHYGRAEYWTIPADGLGDCEDYALTKRRDLIAMGFPAGALRMAVVRTGNGQVHAVLTIATDRGDFVLGNLTDEIESWSEKDFQWIARQDSANAWAWTSLGTGDQAGMTAALSGN